jgi:hypothetical protein
MSLKVQVLKARKILIGSVGVAAVSFVGVGCNRTAVANLPAPPSCEMEPTNPYCWGAKPDAGDAGDVGDAADPGDAGDASDGAGDDAAG